MKMQIRHVHAGIDRTALQGFSRKIVDVGYFESVTRGSADDRGDGLSVESKSVPPILIHRMQRQ